MRSARISQILNSNLGSPLPASRILGEGRQTIETPITWILATEQLLQRRKEIAQISVSATRPNSHRPPIDMPLADAALLCAHSQNLAHRRQGIGWVVQPADNTDGNEPIGRGPAAKGVKVVEGPPQPPLRQQMVHTLTCAKCSICQRCGVRSPPQPQCVSPESLRKDRRFD
jgi:hypothetical protein